VAWLFVRLKLRLMVGALRGPGSTPRIVGFCAAVLAGLWIIPLGFSALAAQHGKPLAVDIGVVLFTVAFAGWLLLPMLMFGTDETLDPARLALLPLRPGAMTRGLLAAALTGIGPVVTFGALLGVVAAAATGPGSAAVGVAAVAVELGLCVTGSRALATGFSSLLRSRRGRDLGVLAGALLSLAVIGANFAVQDALIGGDLSRGVRDVAAIARWAPPGMTAHAIGDAARGDYGVAAAELAAGAGTAALLLLAWMAALRRALVSPDTSTQPGRRGRSRAGPDARAAAGGAVLRQRLWLRPERASRALTVAAKELRYSWRDPRRKAGLLGLLVAVIVTLSVSRLGHRPGGAPGGAPGGSPGARSPGNGALLVGAAVYGGIIAGIQSANQFGQDGGALWLNVAATSRPQDLRADLAGKNLASAVIAMPIFAVLYTVLGLLTGDAVTAAAAFGMAACALGVTLGITSMASILLPYALPERRASAFGGGGTGRGCLAGLCNLAILALALVAMAPVLVPLVPLHTGWWLPLAGPAYGAALAWAGRLAASRVGFRRLPELLAEVSRPV
jgi:ABC-2 type transport system permease protein